VSHYNLEEAIKILEFLRPQKAYLTHISHLMGFYEEVEKELPDFIKLAFDGLVLDLDSSKL
jgi:phosphoribosyl 1,2-cyclic phosphate phosphodiesterase